MAFIQKPDSGALFKNDRKTTDRHPDYKGDALLMCPHCRREASVWLSAWIKEGGSKGKFMSLAFTPKEDKGAAASSPAQSAESNEAPPF